MNLIKFLTNWEYRHFKNKLRGVERMISDLVFKRFKTGEIREQVRQEYDNHKARLSSTEERLKTEKDKKLEDDKVILEREIGRLEAQMKQMDLDIFGSKPTDEYHNGLEGINHQIDALQELKVMVREYIKGL